MRNLMQCAQSALTYNPDEADIIADAAEELERLRARVEELEKLRATIEAETADAKTLDRDDAIFVLKLLRRVALGETAP